MVRKPQKFLKRLTVVQAVPEIPLSIGGKLYRTTQSFCQISVYFSVHSRFFPLAMYILCVYYIRYIHDRGAEGFAL